MGLACFVVVDDVLTRYFCRLVYSNDLAMSAPVETTPAPVAAEAPKVTEETPKEPVAAATTVG